MPIREDLGTPLAGDNPSGVDLRYDAELRIYDKIREARRQDDNLAQGDWKQELKSADYALVLNLAQECLASRSKDLQLAAWLTEALLKTEGYDGLRQGLLVCQDLVKNCWETLYPPLDDGDAELRATPLNWLGTTLDISAKQVALVHAGHDWFAYKESRLVGYEKQAQTEKEKALRKERVDKEHKLTPEQFDKEFAETPKAFYARSEKDLDACLAALGKLDEECGEKFGNAGPSFGKLKTALEEVRHVVHSLLQKKRETEPDPVESVPSAGVANPSFAAGIRSDAHASVVPSIIISVLNSSELPERREAIFSVAKAAAFLRKREPFSPAAYLMMRGLRWGELRAAAQLSDATLLEAPPTELRQHIKSLALKKNWDELLDVAENAMSLPCSRAWLDLQRHVHDACTALGDDYAPIAAAIRSELKVLLHDLPQLLDATLLDDTPTANRETRAWLEHLTDTDSLLLSAPHTFVSYEANPEASAGSGGATAPPQPSWPAKQVDSYVLAKDALKSGQLDRAFELMREEINRQRSGRQKFQRTMQLVQLCVTAGKDAIAQPLLDDLVAAIETHKLDGWEDSEMVATALATVMAVSKKLQGNPSEKQKLFERICRLDPVRALKVG